MNLLSILKTLGLLLDGLTELGPILSKLPGIGNLTDQKNLFTFVKKILEWQSKGNRYLEISVNPSGSEEPQVVVYAFNKENNKGRLINEIEDLDRL